MGRHARAWYSLPLAALLLHGGCEDPTGSADPPGLEIRGGDLNITLEDSARLTAVRSGGNAREGAATRWHSLDSLVATVDVSGLVLPRSVGSTRIVASIPGGAGDTVAVTVMSPLWHAVTAGVSHTCGLTRARRTYCWGSNGDYALGQPATTACSMGGGCSPSPQFLPTERFEQIFAGYDRTCALTVVGALWCWGSGGVAETAMGAPGSGPVPVGGALRFGAVSPGYRAACGLSVDRRAYCWGLFNPMGELGIGDAPTPRTPTLVSGSLEFQSLSMTPGTVTARRTCGVTSAGELYCWGYDPQGRERCGPQDLPCSRTPVRLSEPGRYREVKVSDFAGLCAIGVDGVLYCGQDGRRLEPMPLPWSMNGSALAAGTNHRCVLNPAKHLYCWGGNIRGELGVRAPEFRIPASAATRTGPEHTFAQVSTGDRHTCAITTEGALYCWGSNDLGMLGVGSVSALNDCLWGRECVTYPVPVEVRTRP